MRLVADLIKTYNFLRETSAAVNQGLADFLAGPEQTQGYGAIVQGSGRASCRAYGRAPAWLRGLPTAGALALREICDPYLGSNGWDGPTLQQTSTGGQCEGVQYLISYELRSKISTRFACGEFSEWSVRNSVIGNGGIIIGPVGNIETRITVASTDPNAAEPDRIQFVVPTATGGVFLNLNGVAGRTYFEGCGKSYEYRNVVFTRADGLPDECGDVPPELLPGPNRPPPGNVPTGFEPRVDPTNPDIPFIPLLPTVDPEFGPIEFSPEIGISLGGGGGGPAGARPGSPDGVGGGIAGGGGGGAEGQGEDVPFGPAPSGRVWVGALVEVSVPSALGNIAGSGPENRVFPRVVGNCSLTYSGGRGRAYRIESQWTDLVRPSDGLQVEGVRVNVLPSVSFTVYPVSDETCPEDTCSSEV